MNIAQNLSFDNLFVLPSPDETISFGTRVGAGGAGGG